MFLALVLACGSVDGPPQSVDKGDIELAVARKDLKKICAGLQMDDPDVQLYATEQLRIFDPKETKECLCTHIVDPENGFKAAVAEGLKGERRNALASCFSDLVKNPATKNREAAIVALGELPAPVVNVSLMELAANVEDDPKVRAQAIRSVGGYIENISAVKALFEDSEPLVKAAVVDILGIHKKDRDARKLIKGALDHESPEVRASAMKSYHKHVRKKSDEILCKAMMEDESPLVRKAAIEAYVKTTRVDSIRCLRTRAFVLEEDRDVRAALLFTLKMAEGDAERSAYQVLCDAIPFWLRNYVEDKLPEEDPKTDIVKMQNDLDHKNSEVCFAKAYSSRKGYSCHAVKYISWFYKQVSGKDTLYVPACPGDEEYEAQIKGKK